VTGEHVELAYVDAGYTGDELAAAAAAHGLQLVVVKLPDEVTPDW
jgi:FAD/FMN-containing dehydrogenase